MQIIYWSSPVDKDNPKKCQGKSVFINYRPLYLLPAKYPHAGGFCSGVNGNPIGHLYIAMKRDNLPNCDKNEYTFCGNCTLFCDKLVYE